MDFEKFKELFSNKNTLRQNIEVLVNVLPTTSSNYLPRKKSEIIGVKCFDFFVKRQKELQKIPSSEFKPLLSGLTKNCPSNILQIISLFSAKQIKDLFNAPENAIDKSGGYLLGDAFPYAFTGYIVSGVASRKLNYGVFYDGNNILREKHGEVNSNLVLREIVVGYALHDVLFRVRDPKKIQKQDQRFYAKRWKLIEECFELNKEHIKKEFGKEIDSPVLWMERFLENHPNSPEDERFQSEVVRHAEKMKLEHAIPEVEKMRSTMKV